ncbi:MAG: M3 family metallopeptidase [Gammaproteobacteria bacterium]
MTTADNAILHFAARPRFSEIRPEEADAAVDAVLANLAKAADAAARARPEWNLMWRPLEAAEESVERVWSQIAHMHSVMSVPPWREAHGRNLPKIAAAFARLGQHEGVYKNLRALAQNAETLPAARQKILRDALRDFVLSGADLPPAQKTEFRENSERLSALSAKFEENLLDATNDGAVSAAAEDLGDMPDDIKNAARKKDGKYRFSLLPPSYSAFMQYAPARELRREMYRLYHTRACEYGPAARDNSPLIGEIVGLRNRQAALLGFADYAALALQTRMAESPEAARRFLRDLAARAMPHARRELAELRDFAAAELQIAELQPWDMAFAADRLRRKKFDFSAAELRPYLQTDNVLRGLFACIRKLFGADLRADDAPKWLEETRVFSVTGADGARLGGLYLDLFARDTKRGGAWMAEALSRCRRDGALQHPAAHIVCNFTPPKGDAPALVNWDEAQTLFHEFGHALHHLLTEAEDYSASGMNGVEWDAVELPSQFMENFIWDWRVLEPMTAHVKTGAPMPRALFEKARAARRFHAGLRLLRQIEFAQFDLSLHSSSPRPFMEILRETRRETALLDAPEWDRFPCGFSHIFAGGYAAGYYSYLWAEALSADMFALFEESGDILNADLGARFRREILAAGGTRPAMESFVAARGRAPDSAALLKHYGLA